MDTVVFDIETQNFFTDPGVGRDNFAALRISVVGAYSYLYDKYFIFEENEMARAAGLFAAARRLVGFSMNTYDVPVLTNYFQKLGRVPSGERSSAAAAPPNLWEKERIDLSEEIEMAAKQRVSLSRLAEANLGIKKERHGSEAGALYRAGKMDELKEYCLKDVRLTKELFDLYEKQNYLLMPDKQTGETVRVTFAKPLEAAGLF